MIGNMVASTLDCECYMLGKWWTSAYCKYFQNAVQPLNPALEASFTNTATVEMRPCALCGAVFPANGLLLGGLRGNRPTQTKAELHTEKAGGDCRKIPTRNPLDTRLFRP